MARDIKQSEREDFRGRFGFDPTQIRTAIAPIAIYVSEKNPLAKLSLTEIDAIFSVDRKRGGAREILWWADLGIAGPWATSKIVPMGLGESSQLQTYFKQQALLQGEFRSNLQTTANARALFQAIEVDPNVIGYAELTNPPASVKILAISNLPGEPAVLPNGGNILSETYPLTRYLNVYMARAPFTELDPAAKDFLRFVLSREGQAVVQEQGLMPLPASVALTERERLE